MSTEATEVGKLNGQHALKGRKRSRASVLRGVRTAARRRREALAAGKPYGKRRKRAALAAPRKPAGRRTPGGAIDALTYLAHARSRLLKAAIGGDSGAGATLGLVSLAIEALGGE